MKNTSEQPIWFEGVTADWGELSNFADSPFELDGHCWSTVEHYYQAEKTHSTRQRERIRSARAPMAAKSLGRRVALRRDWERVRDDVMLGGLRAKFAQHGESRRVLLATGDRPLHEDARSDPYWG